MRKQTLSFKFILWIIPFLLLSKSLVAQVGYSTAPEGAIVLFDGKDFSHWTNCNDGPVKWKIVNGAMEIVNDTVSSCPKIRGIKTKENFRDFQFHVEFKLLKPDDNSGIYIQRRYEVQVAYTYDKPIDQYMGGSVYHQKLPDINMGKPLNEWQTYDIFFRSPRFENNGFFDRKVEDARITVLHNGVMIHNNVIVQTKTGVGFDEGPEPGPIMLQDHTNQIRFRNIWIIPGKEQKRK